MKPPLLISIVAKMIPVLQGLDRKIVKEYTSGKSIIDMWLMQWYSIAIGRSQGYASKNRKTIVS